MYVCVYKKSFINNMKKLSKSCTITRVANPETTLKNKRLKLPINWMIYFRIWPLQREKVNKVLIPLWPGNKLPSDIA